MKIKLTSVYVDDQTKALKFYTEVLGFAKKADFSNGPYRWLTVASAEEPDGTQLQLALNNNPAAKAYQDAMFQQNQPATMFFTDDIKGDYERIKASRRRVHHAADRRNRLDHCDAQRYLRQPHSADPAGTLVGMTEKTNDQSNKIRIGSCQCRAVARVLVPSRGCSRTPPLDQDVGAGGLHFGADRVSDRTHSDAGRAPLGCARCGSDRAQLDLRSGQYGQKPYAPRRFPHEVRGVGTLVRQGRRRR